MNLTGLYDQHLHSRYSMDSQADPQANVESAHAKGLSGLIFTEHFDTHPDEWPECIYNDKAYSKTIHELHEKWEGRIFVGKGIEVCFQPQKMDFILDFIDNHEFDMVMLSVHFFDAGPIHHHELWNKAGQEEITERYLRGVLNAASFCNELHKQRGCRVFDVLGHLDLTKRYTQRFLGSYNVTNQSELIDDILRACIAADLTPEINTSSLRQGLDETMPGPRTIKRYAELGGQAVSLGSDAHRSEDIGAGFDFAIRIAQGAGLSIGLFEQRNQRHFTLKPDNTHPAH